MPLLSRQSIGMRGVFLSSEQSMTSLYDGWLKAGVVASLLSAASRIEWCGNFKFIL